MKILSTTNPRTTRRQKPTILTTNLTNAEITYGRELAWSEIKEGQAFYFIGCKGLGVKWHPDLFMALDSNVNHLINRINCGSITLDAYKYYKLPSSLASCLEALK